MGRTVIIRLNSVQLQLQLPTGTELGNCNQGISEFEKVFVVIGNYSVLNQVFIINPSKHLSVTNKITKSPINVLNMY